LERASLPNAILVNEMPMTRNTTTTERMINRVRFITFSPS